MFHDNTLDRNHLIDIYYFMPYYPPTCKDTEEPKITVSVDIVYMNKLRRVKSSLTQRIIFFKKPNFDTAFESSGFMRTKQVRMTQEDAVKVSY